MQTSKVWYITGASQGLGLSLVKQLLAAGYHVAATSRNAGLLQEAAGIIDKTRFLPLTVNLANPDSIDDSIRQTIAAFGRIIALAEHPDPPLHLFLGADAYHRAARKIADMSAELEQWKETTISADF
nr:SDR family NAD(P)-dependent oxidoreductase [uncultured Chitinophaga sp.]